MFKVKGDYDGNKAPTRYDVHADAVMDTIVYNGIDHHYSMARADIQDELALLCKSYNIEMIKP